MKNNLPEKIRFTKEGYAKMEEEFQALTDERVEILVRLQTAREMGDLSENGAYTAARLELGSTDRRLRQLRYLMRFAEVVESKSAGTIDFGSLVTLDNGKKQMIFTLVGKYESDPAKQKLSIEGPLGMALKGKRAGDTVKVHAPAGTTTYRVVKVE
ncbi:MAG: hypothetical protein A2900_02135 [Candidatus Chisholmbacteria bacterium RIFCSPLOWO2_01_FULL_50_28]|uniref:Transcription elongation factor GreA n=1 Tax=Candidatus Chisholmbacteria bacterium RIFCSPHIGHO2_01_FULL_52_32 TaxID=1797591 RepID=A0A1G1VTL4_9BACT|nr:MAG: hypothetical protein A2786_04610 [Candidatus Chisholmbacteria bacterium RIFCSPHIGHO2_01_FULL_52_32]OGY19882.1 MAG: hypothetical protein A2900_02135 [Candidatus Chisholmbacteria bacterium RIFCSPLOWO2_01_FULL_50_28]